MHDRSAWIKGKSGPQIIKGKPYKNLTEFTRACGVCGKPFSIFVTSKIAAGHADSNSFGLKNCEEHRRNGKTADVSETDQLRSANATMREELAALYVRNKAMFEDLQVCKAKLAQYELQPAFEAMARDGIALVDSDGTVHDAASIFCEPVQNTTNGVPAPPLTFPWEKP